MTITIEPKTGRIAPQVATKRLTSVASPRKVIQGTPLRQAQLDSKYDAVIIGSGMGGLSAAVALSKFGGKKVLVLEQHYTAGGLTQVFQRDNKYAWNVGVHYIGGGIGRRGGDVFPYFAALTEGKVTWAAQPSVYDRVFIKDRVYDFVVGKEAWIDKMTGYFPEERKALEQVVKLADEAWDAYKYHFIGRSGLIPGFMSGLASNVTVKPFQKLASQRTDDLLAGLTKNPELKAVLCSQAHADIGAPPDTSAAAYQLGIVKHFQEGGYIPVGGASSFAAAMIPIIEAGGGAVVTQADVSQVLLSSDNSTVVGIKLANGQEITSNTVISNAGVINTLGRLVPPAALAATPALQSTLDKARDLASKHRYAEQCVLYCALEEERVPEFAGVGCMHRHLDYDMSSKAKFPTDPSQRFNYLYISCCDGREQIVDNPHAAAEDLSSSGSSTGEPLSTLQCLTPVSHDWFDKWSDSKWRHRGNGYNEYKQEIKEALIGELGSLFPDLPGRIKYTELSTPLSTDFFTRKPRGDAYGLPVIPERFEVNNWLGFGPDTPLKGLYLSGQDVSGLGIVPSMASGITCAIRAGGAGLAASYGAELLKWL